MFLLTARRFRYAYRSTGLLLLFGLVFGITAGQSAEVVRQEIAQPENILLEPFPHLKGTGLLPQQEAILSEQYQEIENYFLKQIENSRDRRDRVWQPDFASLEAYRLSVAPHRVSLGKMLGLIDPGSPSTTRSRSLLEFEVFLEELEIGIDGDFRTRVLLLRRNVTPDHAIIVIPDTNRTPEELLGLSPSETGVPGWVEHLLARNVAVCVPMTVQRTKDHPLSAQLRGKDRRHILHRLGFVVGRHLVGLEVQQVMAAAEVLKSRFEIERLGIVGRGQGGMTALYAAAACELFHAGAVVDYFQVRDGAWQEPVDRMLYGQIRKFGDAEVAALVAPRPLVLVSTQDGPDAERVSREVARAARFYEGLGRAENLQSIRVGEGDGLAEAVRALIELFPTAEPARSPEWSFEIARSQIERARTEHFEGIKRYLDRLVENSRLKREERWKLLEAPESDRSRRVRQLREDLADLMGVIEPSGPLNPKTRLVGITEAFTAYEVLLGVLPDVHAYGQLLIPRVSGHRRMPAVVCQHGLGGSPQKATGFGTEDIRPYWGFGMEMARNGYVVFAPYVTVPVPQGILINRLVRQAGMLGLMRTSIEVAKLHRIVDFLQALPQVDPDRIGYYGLSYGGYSAIWMSPLEKRLKATIVSGHFNDWKSKITNEEKRTSYLLHPDEDFCNWNILNRLTHMELIAAVWPRAVLIEYGEGDTVTPPEWHRKAWSQVMDWARTWKADHLIERVYFNGRHEIYGVQAFDFLDRWLKPNEPAGRDYVYHLRPVRRELPGIGDTSEDTLPFITHSLDSDPANMVRGTFYLPFARKEPITGFQIRASRVGNPGDLLIRFGTREGGHDLGEARIQSNTIHPLYDLHYAARLDSLSLEPGRLYHFEVTAESGWIERSDYYVLYGPKPLGGTPFPPHFGLSYQVLTDGDSPALQKESRFEFLRNYLDPFSHQPLANSTSEAVRRDEVEITSDWLMDLPSGSDSLVETAAADFARFLADTFQLRLLKTPRSGRSSRPSVSLELQPAVEGVDSEEGFRLEIGAAGVKVLAENSRGIMRGLYRIEETIRRRGGPYLHQESFTSNARFSPRITMPVLAGGSKYSETSRPLEYTDGLLQRISHDGFNAIWIWINTEEATLDSKFFPEFGDPMAAVRLARLEDVARRAKRFGIDVYLYLATGYHHHVPARFYERRPHLKGYGWGNPLCTSQKIVRQYYAETVRTIFRNAPDVKGLVVIYDSEGFYYCGNRERTRLQCPRCRHYSQQHLANQLLRTLKEAMEDEGGDDKSFIAWNYDNASEWVIDLYPMLPKDIIIQSNFSKGTIIERDGIEHRTGDYNITSVGPPQLFRKFYAAARENGLRVMVKTEHAISQEAIYVPYIPVMEQWYRRISSIRDFELTGWFGNWSHYGYTPHSRTARLVNRMSYDPALSGELLLEQLATEDFGPEAVPPAVEAWQNFSEAIRNFPYSDPVARIPGPIQKGPSHPLFLDPEIPNFGRWRSWQNDLDWAKPWGVDISTKYLKLVEEGLERGAEQLRLIESRGQTAQQALAGELRIVSTLISSFRTTLNLVDWIQTRTRYLDEPDPLEKMRLLERLEAIAVRERLNALDALPLLEEDSRLGYASEGGGVVRGGLFSAALVEWKVGQLDHLLLVELPRQRTSVLNEVN